MISAWKRLINKPDGAQAAAAHQPPPGIHKLDKQLQRKFGRGINYNMKVVIKGDNRVGKTSLFLRLKGCPFNDDYTPTETLNVTSIDWSYKATDDVVKIDLWEAVDSTSARRGVNFVDLKLETNGGEQPRANSETNDNVVGNPKSRPVIITTNVCINGCANGASQSKNNFGQIPESARQSLVELSANFDVYKGANAVLLLLDMTKLWTFKYVQQEIVKIPTDVPVLVVANHRDQGHHRTVSGEQVKTFLDSLGREAAVMYTEASMRNGFGMKFIEKFFNVPFLKLQEKSLLKQLDLNRHEFAATKDELKALQETTNVEYEQYLELETIRRRQQADAMSPINNGLKQLDEATREQIRNATMSCDSIDKSPSNLKSIESNPAASKQNGNTNPASQSFVNDRLPSIVIGAKCPLPETKSIQLSVGGNSLVSHQVAGGVGGAQPSGDAASGNNNKLQSQASESQTGSPAAPLDDYESDESVEDVPRANPLVANYQSDLDSDD